MQRFHPRLQVLRMAIVDHHIIGQCQALCAAGLGGGLLGRVVPQEEPLAIGGYLPLEKVYELEPVPEELTEEEGKHILGAQGNVWTEYIKTADHAEYMTFPRLLAMAEVGWTPAERKDWDDFNRRVGSHVERLDARGFNFRPLDGNDP